jgi:xylan 1,4-beta-xylosidase
MKKNLIYIVCALVSLPLLIYISNIVQKILSHASPISGNIVIDSKSDLGKINSSWSAFSQGGEEPPPMLTNTVSKMRQLSPKLIRIDHIYDYYNVVKQNGKDYTYDFSKLDETVNDIISMGALPFFSLSYMPQVFTSSGSVIDTPVNWSTWKELVKKTVEHYSGKNEKNLNGVYYEIWNEPELPQFGSFNLSGSKDYRILYFNSVQGATDAQNVNEFFIGGPAVGSYYKNWLDGFLNYVTQNKLRLDFFSWHRYHKDPNMFSNDAKNIRRDLGSYNDFKEIPIMLTEWGINSEKNQDNNSVL